MLASAWEATGQSLKKLEHRAINRTHLTFVNGDTVQRFTITSARPSPRANRFYYWQGPTRILRTAGAYDGKLLTGPYQLTSRNGNLLGSGTFHNGLKTGRWRTWRADGTPLTSNNWHQGRQRGNTVYYDEVGQLRKPAALLIPPPADATKKTRLWEYAHWKGVLKRVKIRRRNKSKQLVTPSTVPGKAVVPSVGPSQPPQPGS